MRQPTAFSALAAAAKTMVLALLISSIGVGVASAATPTEASWQLLHTFAEGNGPDQVAQAYVEGATARGPQAVSLAPDGSIYVLDSVNARAHVLDANGTLVRTVTLAGVEYPRELLVMRDRLIVVDDTERIVELGLDGSILKVRPLPDGMISPDVLRLMRVDERAVMWAGGYTVFDLDTLPAQLNLSIKDRSGRGLPIGSHRVLAEFGGPFAVILVGADGAPFSQISAQGTMGAVRPIGSSPGQLFFLVEDLFGTNTVRVEQTIRRIDGAGRTTGLVRLPFEEFQNNPRRVADVENSGDLIVIVPRIDATSVYRVTLGQRYHSQIAGRAVTAASATASLRGPAGSFASPLSGTSPLTRAQVSARANNMVGKTWTWHTSYNVFHDGTARGSWTAPEQIASASEGTGLNGIPYAMGGFDTDWSHTDWAAWSTWETARTYYYPGSNGPLMGNITTGWAGSGSAGLDCAGLVYAAAGLETQMVNAKKGTIHLISAQSNWYAGLDAGAAGNAQPFNYFVRDDQYVKHTFYYEQRRTDMTGYWTIESTVDGSPDGAHEYSRTWGDIATYTHRSWWSYSAGDSQLNPRTYQGADFAGYDIKGQNVWYTYSASSAHYVTLASISGGDPDLYVLNTDGSLVGRSINSGSNTESVYVPNGGTFYVIVYIYSSNGGHTYYTLSRP